jgi:hypothetical protein
LIWRGGSSAFILGAFGLDLPLCVNLNGCKNPFAQRRGESEMRKSELISVASVINSQYDSLSDWPWLIAKGFAK